MLAVVVNEKLRSSLGAREVLRDRNILRFRRELVAGFVRARLLSENTHRASFGVIGMVLARGRTRPSDAMGGRRTSDIQKAVRGTPRKLADVNQAVSRIVKSRIS